MQTFNVGYTVRIRRGPYASFVGVVEKVSLTKLAVVVRVNIFGHRIPVAVASRAVEKVLPEEPGKRIPLNLN
jgi:transcription antitermination factor NusG